MNILILAGAGFIGTNLTIKLAQDKNNQITVVDTNDSFFTNIREKGFSNVTFKTAALDIDEDFETLLYNQDVVYHLVSTTVPGTSNQKITQELMSNVVFTSKLLDACVKMNIQKVIFLSSGGTVYGKENKCPLREKTPTNPISSYGVQKVTIEKLLYLYRYLHGLDYRIIRLANPYGPYQRPNGMLGAVTTFTYKALKDEEIIVYGDGSVVRDYIFIDDAIRAIIKIADGENRHRTFNLGCGYGVSIKELITAIQNVLGKELKINYQSGRKVDVPVNYLDITRYEKYFGSLNPISLEKGIRLTADFMTNYYSL